MKRYGTAILLILALLGLFYWLFDESLRAQTRAKSSYDATQAQVDGLKAQREASSNQIISLNRSVRDSVEFLTRWKNYYAANRDYEATLTKIADKTKCAVVARKWESKKINLGKLDYETDTFTGIVVGDYRDVVNFVGQMEGEMELSTIWTLDFKVRENVNEVACTMTVCFPNMVFDGGGAL